MKKVLSWDPRLGRSRGNREEADKKEPPLPERLLLRDRVCLFLRGSNEDVPSVWVIVDYNVESGLYEA